MRNTVSWQKLLNRFLPLIGYHKDLVMYSIMKLLVGRITNRRIAVIVPALLFILLPLINTTTRAEPTDNYTTYQNPTLGFSIDYPNNMTVSENTTNGFGYPEPAYTILFKPSNSTSIPHLLGILIHTEPAAVPFRQTLSLDDGIRILQEGAALAHATIINQTKAELSGLLAYRVELQYPTVHVIAYVTVNSNTLYQIAFQTVDQNPETNFVPAVNSIIDSLHYK